MSELRVDSVKSKGGGAPDLPKGVTISGITTAATLGATQIDVSNVNVSGVVTSGTLSGSLLSTGTPTLGLGVTINSSGLVISGVATAGIVSATTLYGDGSNLTGIGATLAPLFYNPDINDATVSVSVSGIGVTFNSQVKAGSGNVTLRIAGAAGTVVENFGVGNSATVSENRLHFTPSSNLDQNETYFVQIPGTALTNNEGTAYVGTGYTFNTEYTFYQMWAWGSNGHGIFGNNSATPASSPIQIPGTTWQKGMTNYSTAMNINIAGAIKTDGTLWSWGYNSYGILGQNEPGSTNHSSPIQIGSGTDWSQVSFGVGSMGLKTDGTLWAWGDNTSGVLGLNSKTHYSSPVQVPGTTWKQIATSLGSRAGAVKTDGTLWNWGVQTYGQLGQGNNTNYSSPRQVPGTTWDQIAMSSHGTFGIRTDGTLWYWGQATNGQNGTNEDNHRSSPKQIPGTTWAKVYGGQTRAGAIKTDGTLWTWGSSTYGALGLNEGPGSISSPKQIPGTTWSELSWSYNSGIGLKTDGTLWSWGYNGNGELGQSSPGPSRRSSPVQIPGTTWTGISKGFRNFFGFQTVNG